MKKLYCIVVISIVLFYSSINAQWLKTGFNDAKVTSIVAKEGNLFSSTWGNAIYGSTDGGATWTADTNGLGYWFFTSYVYALAVLPFSDHSEATNLFAGMEAGGIWRSTDDGYSWTWVYPLGVLGEHDMNFLALGSAGSTVLAGVAQTDLNGVYRSVNDGGTRTRCNAGFVTEADSNIKCFTSITVGTTTYFYVGTYGGLFISTSDGTSWTRISNGLPAGIITAVVATPPSDGNTDINLFVGVSDTVVSIVLLIMALVGLLQITVCQQQVLHTLTQLLQARCRVGLLVISLLHTELCMFQRITVQCGGIQVGPYQLPVRRLALQSMVILFWGEDMEYGNIH